MASWDVYRNLHQKCWSYRQGGLRVEHAERLVVLFPAFVVQPAGNARVRREKAKSVHAFVRSQRRPVVADRPVRGSGDWVEVTYNPYKHTSFVEAKTGRTVVAANVAVLDADGKCYVEEPVYPQEDQP